MRRHQITTLASAALLAPLALSACDRAVPSPPPASPATANRPASEAAAPPAPTTAPAASASWKTVTSLDREFTVRWTAQPDPIPARDPFAITVELFEDPDCRVPLTKGDLAVDAAMPQHGHGMNLKPTIERLAPGRYRVSNLLFHMPGRWELAFDWSLDGMTVRAQTTVDIPLSSS